METTGYYIRKGHRAPSERVYHDPSGHYQNGKPCSMVRHYFEDYEWVKEPPKGYRLCGRCPQGQQ